MEFAIPMLALGAAYVISVNKSKNALPANTLPNPAPAALLEPFGSMGASPNSFMQPPLDSNYPTANPREIDHSVNTYPNAHSATDAYFTANSGTSSGGGSQRGTSNDSGSSSVYSLTGETIDKANFMFGNMVPYYGASTKGADVANNSQSELFLDNMTGSGSQTLRKMERAPLFKPEADMQWAHGAPNASAFIQSRMVQANKESNTKPFESQRVGPGLNQGFAADGADGFNSGMAARETWMPKSVDELRVANNPKTTYTLENLEGPSLAKVQNRGVMGVMEKNRPERAWSQSSDQWLTTTGAEIAPRLRTSEAVFETMRNETSAAYAGAPNAHDRKASYPDPNFKPSTKIQLQGFDIGPSCAAGRGDGLGDKDRLAQSYTPYGNNRSTTQTDPHAFGSGFAQALGAVVVPFLDIFNPTRREEYSRNLHTYGDAGTTVPQTYLVNAADAPAPTIREATMYAPGFNVNNQHELSKGAYTVANEQPVSNQRDTTQRSYTGDVGGAATHWGPVEYDMVYKTQINNELKEATALAGRINQGNMSLFTQTEQMNVCLPRDDADRENNRMWVATAGGAAGGAGPAKEMLGAQKGVQTYAEVGVSRMDAGLLDAFRANPYTQSLESCV